MPTRLVVCVDGTRYDPGGGGSQTSIYRIYASIKVGRCFDGQTGKTFDQVPKYVTGVTSLDDVFSRDKLQSALPGHGYHKHIQDVYEACSKLGEEDEVVLFGYSRGAYVVRAVAGLLHHFGALASAGQPEFAKDYRKVVKESDRGLVRSFSLRKSDSISSLSTSSSAGFRGSPKIRFVGIFDTIKPVNDDSAYDIDFTSSIQHLRHAIAIHEDRKALSPEYIYPKEFRGVDLRKTGRSEVQAWFIGSHNDMGGAAAKGGLALYPLQWMLLEAHACAISIDFDGTTEHGSNSQKPLSAVFPLPRKKNAEISTSSFQAANGMVVTMQDLRDVHAQTGYSGQYTIKLGSRYGSIRAKKARTPFDIDGSLRGYCDHAPQGTIIHPSVYLLLDEHISVALDTKEAKLQRSLEDWRKKTLGTVNGMTNFGFWGGDDLDFAPDPGAIRVLVCGNTGVGKSTLINKTFGVDVTQSSDRSRGIHDVRKEITFDGRPDLVVHDSGGFEAGADAEFLAIEEFLRQKSTVVEVEQRLHVIWFCVEINSARTLQKATEKLFQAVGKYADEVPIVVVATKKDDLLDIEFMKRKKELKRLKQPFDDEACESYAEEQLQIRLDQIREEMESVGRLDALVAVSQEDDDSIANLSKTTSHHFSTDKVRLLYIRAQVARLDLKTDLALTKTTHLYRSLVKKSTALSFTPSGPTLHRRNAASHLCKSIITCFGLPSLSGDTAIEILKHNVWNHLGFDVNIALAECLNTLGYIGTGLAGGMPAWLVSGAISLPLVVPATCRLFLTMACDLILVLTQSFLKVAAKGTSGQPSAQNLRDAARAYRLKNYSERIHHAVGELIPKRNVKACYEFERIRRGVEDIVEEYRDRAMDGTEAVGETRKLGMRGSGDGGDDVSVKSGSTLYDELKEANAKAVELEATQAMAELPGEREPAELETRDVPRVELPATDRRRELTDTDKPIELEAPGSTLRVHELQG